MFIKSLRSGISKIFWRLSGWKLVREKTQVEGPRILIGAPHTSNFDFLLMLGIAWDAKMNIYWLGKKELFRGIFGPIMRGLGGIPVDRKNASSVVNEIVQKAKSDESFILVVTPEGTRQGKGWRSGFYRIAYESKLPVTLGFADGATRTSGLGITMSVTGDVESDMNQIREFYKDITGAKPQYRTEPRLNDEAGLTKQLKSF